jgi:hypothetical protein
MSALDAQQLAQAAVESGNTNQSVEELSRIAACGRISSNCHRDFKRWSRKWFQGDIVIAPVATRGAFANLTVSVTALTLTSTFLLSPHQTYTKRM